MWLTSSSIGRKFVMAVTGVCLVLFVTFHVLMNSVALLWPAAYNQICMFLGANWYALVASAGLAFLFIIHIIYALWLTLQNRKARPRHWSLMSYHFGNLSRNHGSWVIMGIMRLHLPTHQPLFARMYFLRLGKEDPGPKSPNNCRM